MPDTDVHTNHRAGSGRAAFGAFDLDGPPSRRTVADMIRAVPASIRRASLRADSCNFNRPSRGSTTCIRSGSTRIAPVVNRTLGVVRRRDLNRGKPDGRPARFPLRESVQFFNPRASASRPVLNASFDTSPHHGATSGFAAFHAFRRPASDQDSDGVSNSSGTP
jgi:hypothetical protein